MVWKLLSRDELKSTIAREVWRTEIIGDGIDERLDRAIHLMARGANER